MSFTVNDLITLAMKAAGVYGVGQSVPAEDASDALSFLQLLLQEWQQNRWLVYHLVDVSKVSTGAATYSVGATGDFVVTRPDMINAGFFRQLFNNGQQPVDYPFTIIPSREDWNNVALKSLGTFPAYLFYDATYPLGTLYLHPIPASGEFEIHLTVKETLNTVTSLTQTVSLPPEYQSAIVYNLAREIRMINSLPPDPLLIQRAQGTLETIRSANAQIPLMASPITPGYSGWFNVYSGQQQ